MYYSKDQLHCLHRIMDMLVFVHQHMSNFVFVNFVRFVYYEFLAFSLYPFSHYRRSGR